MQFLNSPALWALSLIGLPIIIHLFSFRRPQRIVFSNVKLLQNLKQATNSYSTLKHLLILLTRILAITALVFLFALPFINRNNSTDQIESAFIYIDNSASTQNFIKGSNTSILNEALKSVTILVSDLPKSVKVKYLDNSFLTDHINYTDKKDLANRISAIDYAAKWREPDQLISRIGRALEGENLNALFYYSDFQKISYKEDLLKELQKTSSVQLVHLAAEQNANLYVDSVFLVDEFIRINESFNLSIKVNNAGTERRVANLKLLVGDTQTGTTEIELGAGESKSISFSVRLEKGEEVLCKIILDDQPVVFDNEYFFRLQPSENLKVVNIMENPVVAINRVFSNEPIFKYETLSAQNVNYQQIENADLIILSELAELSSGLIDNIKRQVQNGASVFIIPSKSATAATYQSALYNLGLRGIEVKTLGTGRKSVSAPAISNPWFSNVFEKLPKNIQTPSAQPLLTWSRSGLDILKFKDGGNYLSEFKTGDGNVYLLASPLSTQSDFAANALFVPVMYKIAMHSMQNVQPLAYSIGQGTIRVPVTATSNKETVLKLEKEGVQYIPEQQFSNQVVNFTLPGELESAGFYKLTDGKGFSQTVALNYDKRESQLDAYSLDELKAMAAPYKNVKVVGAEDVKQIGKQVNESYFGTPLWKYALLICLLAIALETAFIRFL